jgi:methionyl-tRNA synthetase
MAAALDIDVPEWPADIATALEALPAGHRFEVPEVLFNKIDDAQREAFEARFAGG